MNQTIKNYFDQVEAALIESAAIYAFCIVRREVSLTDGKLRLRAELVDGNLLEMFAYVVEHERQISIYKYSFHWQTQTGELISRWDNAPHYMYLRTAPHHRHNANGTVSEIEDCPDFLSILKTVEDTILR